MVCFWGSFFLSFFFPVRPWQNSWRGGEGRSKDNPEVGMVPLPTPESGLCGPGRHMAGWLGKAAATGQQRPKLNEFRACLKAGERQAQEAALRRVHRSFLLATTPHSGLQKRRGSLGAGWAEPHYSAACPNSRFRHPLLSVF